MNLPPPGPFFDKFDRITKKLMGVRTRPDPRKSDVPIFATFQDRVFSSMIDVSLIFLLFQELFGWMSAMSDRLVGDMRPLLRLEDSSTIQRQTTDPLQSLKDTAYDFLQAGIAIASSPSHLLEQMLTSLFLGLIFVVLWSRFHTTPGKFVLGLRIRGRDGEGDPDLSTYVRRFLGCYLSMPIFMIGYAALGFDKQKRAWHDRIAGTTVIYTREGHVFRRGWDLLKKTIKGN